MPDDILDAAQKAINEAATGAKATSQPTDAPAPPLPIEPSPMPAVAEQSSPTPTEQPKEETPTPTPPIADPSLDATKQAMMNELLGSSTVAPATEHSAAPKHGNGNFAPKKKPRSGIILAVIALLLLTVPVIVYFMSQKNNSIAELRGRASWDTVYQGCTINSCPQGYTCHCQNGNACTYTWCEAGIEESCRAQGREYCTNGYNGNAKTCCLPGYHCGTAQNPGCFQGGGDDNGDDDTVQPTATPPTTPVCQNIKIYKGGAQVTPSTLLPGDVVTLAVKGNLSPAKARFRVNGGAWQETTTKNASNEFTLSFTVPDGVPDFVIEGEVNTNGAWY